MVRTRLRSDTPIIRTARTVVIAGLAVSAVTTAGLGQTPPTQTLPGLPPGLQNPVPQGSPIPRVLPRPAPNVAPGPLLPPPPAPAAEIPHRPVRIVSVAVAGVTAYPAAEIERYTTGLVGPATALDQVDAARQAILNRYRGDGYVLTTVSAAIDAQGRLRFQVIEGRIASVKLDHDIGPAGVQVLRFLQRLTEEQPISSATLERYLLLAQDVPGVTVHATLQPSTDEPGALTLVASVSRQAVSGLVVGDNRAFRLTGPIEAIGVVDFNSFTEYGERTELSLYHAFPDSQTFGQAATELFLGGSGLKLRVYAGAGPSNPTGPLQDLGYQGFTTVFGGQISYPVIRSRQQNLNVYGTFDGLESTIDTFAGGTNGSRGLTSQDSLRILRTGADYSLSDLWLSDELPAVNTVTGRISQGVPILGASRAGDDNLPRAGEEPEFFKFNFELTRTQTLYYPWEGASIALMGLLTGQLSPDVLPPEEQFFLGGLRFTRGFYAGQVVGDNALAATAELQLNTPLPVERLGINWPVTAQFYAFYDWGETWQNQRSDANSRLASTGGGVRLALSERIETDFEGVGRLTRYPNGNAPGIPGLYGGAFYWRALLRF
jgi:hemolysin activation/secretion protein